MVTYSFRVRALDAFAAAATLTSAGLMQSQFVHAAPPGADPLAHLAGRWVGDAVMTTASGPASNFKCVVTYLPRKDAPGMQQNLRCDDGSGFKLNAATEIAVEGDKVIGRWQDKINEIDGTVAGNVTPDGFVIHLAGKFFDAKMAVSGSGCDQSVKVFPASGHGFRELDAKLKKC